MADIDVVPHKRTNTWLWIVLAIVAALIVWAVIGGMSGAPDQVSRTDIRSLFSSGATVLSLTS